MLKLGILGFPLGHTLSPVLHGVLMEKCGLSGTYLPYAISPEGLQDAFAKLKAVGMRGLNVTIPHKVAIMPLLDEVSPEAKLLSAVNTVSIDENGITRGENTDMPGFWQALPPAVAESCAGASVLVLGAGGSARAVIGALIRQGAGEITLAVRNPDKAMETVLMAEAFRRAYQQKTLLKLTPWDPAANSAMDLAAYRLVVNTTPIGMSPQAEASPLSRESLETLPPEAFVSDLIYRPMETRLMQDCRAAGLACQSGLEMLIRQGIESFRIWTGETVPADWLPEIRERLMAQLTPASGFSGVEPV